jgi:iron complex outermembrane receptor protein
MSVERRWLALVVAAVLLPSAPGSAAQDAAAVAAQGPSPLTKLSLEELANLRVSVVARRPQRQWDTPAATAVVSGEEILRSGVTSFPEALRLTPGVQVARANSNRWAIGVRGFTSTLSRSLLVLIDGRSVYTPLFAGVYWEQQHVLLADVDRIEVVRGPGGTLWGANAVNGVVNLVTRSAHDTRGLHVEAGGGNVERAFGGIRHGGRLGADADYRVYGKYFRRSNERHVDGADFDDWSLGQGGFRVDARRGSRDELTLQGDLYDGRAGQRRPVASFTPPYRRVVDADGDVSGGNLLGRWRRRSDDGRALSAQVWYDRTDRTEAYLDESRDTFDVELQHDLELAGSRMAFGLGYRVTSDSTSGVPTPFFDPEDRTDHLFSTFAQGERPLAGERLVLTLGAKLEHNDYSGFEVQPSARLLWSPSPRQRAWLAASRAVRTPSRADTDQVQTVFLQAQGPTFLRASGDKQFESETALVFEAGYRLHPLDRLSLETAVFYDRYGGLLGGRVGTLFAEPVPPPPHLVLPVLFGNLLEAETWGSEVSFDARPLPAWRLHGGYSFLRMDVRPERALPGITADNSERASPRHQLFVRSAHDLPGRATADLFFRHVSGLPAQNVPAYSSLDARLAWRPAPALELAVVGQNLLQPHHKEWTAVEIRRGFYAQVAWRR